MTVWGRGAYQAGGIADVRKIGKTRGEDVEKADRNADNSTRQNGPMESTQNRHKTAKISNGNKETKASRETGGKKISSVGIVKNNISENNTPPLVQERIAKARKILDQNIVRVTIEPSPVAVYIKNVRRGPTGTIRSGLQQSLPICAFLRFSFIGASVLEFITDDR